jgi:hypothetical protein
MIRWSIVARMGESPTENGEEKYLEMLEIR